MGIAKKGSGQISVTRRHGVNPGGVMSQPGPGDSSGSRMADKGSGQFSVDRTVKSPPRTGPAK